MMFLPAILLVIAIIVQALWPRVRVPVVVLAAALAVVSVKSLGLADAGRIVAAVPWDVLILLIALGALSQIFAEARVFERIAVFAARRGGADPRRVFVVFGIVMYSVSALVNNLTALLLVLPVLLVLLRLTGTSERHARWTISIMLVTCNLGGAATPIGDFPAILLLGAGALDFLPYLVRALPMTLIGLAVVLVVAALVVKPAKDVESSEPARRLTVAVVEAIHRNIRIRLRLFIPAAATLALMLVAWATLPARVAPPELIAWIGVPLALLSIPREAARVLRRSVDIDATLFLFALFVLVGCVQQTGFFTKLAESLLALPLPASAQLVVFLVAAGLLTGLFSAGPSMAALLVVARALTTSLPADAVYVGLALSVCAGSSLFLTAATAGPLAQGLVENARINDADGKRVQLGFAQFLPTGALCYCIIQATAIAWGLGRLAW